MTTHSDEIPVIDVAPFLAGDPAGKAGVVAQVKSACERIGFFTMVGHGVPEQLIEDMRSVSNEFFALPLEEKLRYKRDSRPGSPPGYSVMGDVALAKTLDAKAPAPDYQEGYVIGRPDVSDAPYWQTETARKFFFQNIWPERPARFREVYEKYYMTANALAGDVMRIFALALDLEENYFRSKIDKAYGVMKITNYPEQHRPPVEGQVRSGAHTDYGTVTLLMTEDKPGGLQVRTREGKWVDVHPTPNAYVINLGDLMMQWTNDHWISTLHRVGNPPREFAHIARLSLVFFHVANYDAEVQCIERYAGAASKPKYAPTTVGAHFLAKQTKARETSYST